MTCLLMDTKKLANLICLIIGKDRITRRQKEDIIGLLEAVLTGIRPTEKEVIIKEVTTPNDIKEEPNTVDLASAFEFKMPDEMKLEVEGMEGFRTIKILPDGVTETPTDKEAQDIPVTQVN